MQSENESHLMVIFIDDKEVKVPYVVEDDLFGNPVNRPLIDDGLIEVTTLSDLAPRYITA